METNEIMNNEEVMETTTEEVVKASSGKGFKVAAGIGLAVLAGVVIYKYVGKPMIAKIKAQKEQQIIDAEWDDSEEPIAENEKEDSEEANYWLGEIYSTSKQIPHDFAKALKYYQESANKGYIKAQMKLGEAYITGNTELVKKNRYKSLEWFRKAVEQGDPTAPYIVAIILEDKFLKSGGSFDELEELKKMEKEIEEDKIRFYGMIDSIIDKELIQRIWIALLTL